MAFPKTWSEELMAEYLELKGYFVVTGYPVQIGKAGGRKAIDVLGIKVENNKLKIIHIETGSQATSSSKAYRNIKNKFFDIAIENQIKEISKKFGYTADVERWYWDIWSLEFTQKGKKSNLQKDLKKDGIVLFSTEGMFNEIKKSMERWKEENKTSKGNKPTLPENLWMLKMLEVLSMLCKRRSARAAPRCFQ